MSRKTQDSWPVQNSSKDSLPSPSTTPTRASRTKGFANETPYPSFIRTNAANSTTTFSIGDGVIVGSTAAPRQKWLQPPAYLAPQKKPVKRIKSDHATEEQGIWKHEDGLRVKEKVAIIIGLYEDASGKKVARLRWFARPGAVFSELGPADEDEAVEPYELYYTADSKYLEEVADNWTPGKIPRSTLTSLRTPLCTDSIGIEHITGKANFFAPSNFSASTRRNGHAFVVKKVFDVNPVRGAEFFGEIDWEEVLNKGLTHGEWNTEEIRLPEELGMDEDDDIPKPVKKPKKKKVVKAKEARKSVAKKVVEEEGDEDMDEVSHDDDQEGQEEFSDNDSASSSDDDDQSVVESDAEDSAPGSEVGKDDTLKTPTKKRQRKSSGGRPKKPATPRRVVPKVSKTALQRAEQRAKNRSNFKKKQRVSSGLPPPFTVTAAFKKLSEFERAKALLHVSATPETLPCRDDQRLKISALLGDAILNQSGTCLYIHGVPGTGKTATVHSVVRELQEDQDMDSFQFVEINGMKISEPNTAFTMLWEAISGQHSPPRQALGHLENHFQTPDPTHKTTVVLVDELDQMITKKQDVIYNFFNWPQVAHSRLIVIAIANTMDLPERELSGKIRSRLGSNRIPFPTYSWKELEAILQARLQGLSIFQGSSLERIAKSVALVSGDARRALDVARRTVEKKDQYNHEKGVKELCTMADVAETYREMTNYGSTAFVKQASLHQKIFLLALCQCIKRAGVPEVDLETVIQWHLDFLRQTAIEPVPSHTELFDVAADLHGLRLLATESQRGDYFQRVRAVVANDDLFEVLKMDENLKRHVPKMV